MNPYLVLGLPSTATDAEIRKAYLAAIRVNPPDVEPEKFQAISHAYSKIKDEESRIRYMLFNREPPGESPMETLIGSIQAQGLRPLSSDAFQAFLRTCPKN